MGHKLTRQLNSFSDNYYMNSCVCIFVFFQSSYPMRMNRCNQILKKAISLKKSLEKFIGDANRLTDKLLELCNKPVKTHTHTHTHEIYVKITVTVTNSLFDPYGSQLNCRLRILNPKKIYFSSHNEKTNYCQDG